MNRTDRSIFASWWWTIDRTLIAAALALLVGGLVLSFAASPAIIALAIVASFAPDVAVCAFSHSSAFASRCSTGVKSLPSG